MKKLLYVCLFLCSFLEITQAQDTILIIDFGSPITHHIKTCLEQIHIHAHLCWHSYTQETLEMIKPKGIILSGSPLSVIDQESPRVPDVVFSGKYPVLGICYGQQLMCVQLGGSVSKSTNPEFGRTELFITNNCNLTKTIWPNQEKPITIWMGHEDIITILPPGFTSIAHTHGSPHAFIADDTRKFYGVQFHPEAQHVTEGHKLIHAFATNIVQAEPDFSMQISSTDEPQDQPRLLGCCRNLRKNS